MSLVVCIPAGRKKYYIRGTVRVGNKVRDVYETTGVGVQVANGRKLADEIRFQVEERIRQELIYGAQTIVTWQQAVIAYAENREKERREIDASLVDEPDKQMEYVLKWTEWFDKRGKLNLPLRSIDAEDLAEYFRIHHEKKKNKLSTQKREAAAYLAVMNFAREKWKLGDFEKPDLGKKVSRPKPVNKWLYVEEVSLFIRLAPTHLTEYVAGIFATGCRGGSILYIPRHRPISGRYRGQGLIMDRGKELFCLGQSKSGTEDVRILPDWYADRLRIYLNHRTDSHDALFLTDAGEPYLRPKRQAGFQTKTAWRTLRQKVAAIIRRLARLKAYQASSLNGDEWEDMMSKSRELRERAEVVETVTPHWGRHNLASHAFIKGMDTEKVKRLGNWQSNEMVARYQHLRPGYGKELANLVQFPKAQKVARKPK